MAATSVPNACYNTIWYKTINKTNINIIIIRSLFCSLTIVIIKIKQYGMTIIIIEKVFI